jgi:ribosomal-protein-alanine N-acetyltransferase
MNNRALKVTMKLKTQRLQLRTITMDDIENIHNLNSQPKVANFSINDVPENIEETRKEVRPYVQSQHDTPRKNYSFSINLLDTDEFIGLGGISLLSDKFKMGEIYYKLLPTFWNKGYATEVSKCLIKLGFEELSLHRIEAGTNTDNYASVKVLEKSGMQREGLRRKIVPMNGKWNDGYLYAIIEDDYRKSIKTLANT